MAGRGDSSTTRALSLSIANVLPERGCAGDRWLVDLLVLPDVVDGAVAGDGANLLALCGARAVAGVFLDVVLDQWVRGPAVD